MSKYNLGSSEQPPIYGENEIRDKDWDDKTNFGFVIFLSLSFLASYLFFSNFYFV